MNILKNVINKLSQEEKKEVNLASEKVELSTIKDLGRNVIQANSLFQDSKQVDITKEINEANKLIDTRESLIDLHEVKQQNQIKELKELKIKLQKELENKLKDYQEKSEKNLQSIQKDLLSNAKQQNSKRKNLNKNLEKTISLYNALVRIEKELIDNMNKVLKQSKDLGIDVRSVKVWTEGDKLLKSIDSTTKKLNQQIEKGRNVYWNDAKLK